MRQTITLLAALVLCLMVITGVTLMRSTKESDLRAEINRLTMERDALNQQLQAAVLSSQEANDAVTMQSAEKERLQQALAAANLELETLREAMHQRENTP